MRRRSRVFWVGLITPFVLILVAVVVFVTLISYNRAHNNAFAACDVLTTAEGNPSREFGFRWFPPGFECVLYDEDGAVIRRERV